MNEIKIIVTTNRDIDKGLIWPTYLICKPEIGERISTINGGDSRKIVGIEHSFNNRLTQGSVSKGEHFLRIEVS